MSFVCEPLAIPDVLLISANRHDDERGFLAETLHTSIFATFGIPPFVQENVSYSRAGVLRGLHVQVEPYALGKLVRCARGRIFDVAVDVRRGSATFGRWVSLELDERALRMLWIPPGFAHGFLALSDAEVIYKQTGYHAPAHERAIAWNDPALAIAWPRPDPILSAKDAAAPRLAEVLKF
ncbi:MAG: dTDP-4-dehydrorhamnose 3,5-epimerase [Deltaproteobacteria bacterium]|nr:dTDP-4-dehydrorhamnose 3,5-epimerase [Deltaproteobacteria bacterium]